MPPAPPPEVATALALRPRLTAEERREALLDAAQHTFARRGYRGASTAEIAAACGCSEPVLYKHFASKRDLFVAVLLRRLPQVQLAHEEIARADDPLGELEAHVIDKFRHAGFCETVRLRLHALSAADEPEIAAALRELLERFRAGLAMIVRSAQERGLARRDVDPGEVAWLWASVMLAAGMRETLYGDAGIAALPQTLATLIDLVRTEGTR